MGLLDVLAKLGRSGGQAAALTSVQVQLWIGLPHAVDQATPDGPPPTE